MPKTTLTDLTGQTFGRLTVLHRSADTQDGRVHWVCQCICGTVKLVRPGYLLKGRTKSCGCLKRERTLARNTTHGMAHNPQYAIWGGMIKRCENPNDSRYAYYGGRGINVCARWRDSFENFLTDMGPRPSPAHSLERRDNSQGYSTENCLWATKTTQARNRRSNRIVTYNGVTQCLQAWSEQLHIPHNVLTLRMKRGWSVEKALTTPIRQRYKIEAVHH